MKPHTSPAPRLAPTLEQPSSGDWGQATFARRAAALLAQASTRLPHDVEQRLRVAREQAVATARHVLAAQATRPAGVLLLGGGAAGLSGAGGLPGTPWWARFAAWAPGVVLALGLVAIDRLHDEQRVMAAVEIDSALLADDLPPAAYSDPGFAQFVRQSPP